MSGKPNADYVRLWPTRRATVAHIYRKGPGTYDAALCGALLRPDNRPMQFVNDPVCTRCEATHIDGSVS